MTKKRPWSSLLNLENCSVCGKYEGYVFVYPECDLVCKLCGGVQYNRTNYVYAVDPLLKKPKSLDDYVKSVCHSDRLATCDYHPGCDISVYRRSKPYHGYKHWFHFNELVALPGLRPPIPEAAIDFILDGANDYYSEPANAHKSVTGSGFSHYDARGICDRAAQRFSTHCIERGIEEPRPRKGERDEFNSFRLRKYAERWVQIWRIILGDLCDPKVHPILPWPLEERIRIRGDILVSLWIKHCKVPKYEPLSNSLQSHNCRFAIFIRAILCVEDARTSLRRVFPLTGIQETKWYNVLKFLWLKLPDEGSSVYVKSMDCTVRVEWPLKPPSLEKIKKETPKFSSNGSTQRWYEAANVINIYHDKLIKRRCQLKLQKESSWQPYC